MDAFVSELATAIKERRRSLRLTQGALADLAECSPRLIGQLEKGKTGVSLDRLLPVLAVLGLDLELKARGEEK